MKSRGLTKIQQGLSKSLKVLHLGFLCSSVFCLCTYQIIFPIFHTKLSVFIIRQYSRLKHELIHQFCYTLSNGSVRGLCATENFRYWNQHLFLRTFGQEFSSFKIVYCFFFSKFYRSQVMSYLFKKCKKRGHWLPDFEKLLHII